MSLDYNKFIDFWQGVVAQSVYEQGRELLSYAESLESKPVFTVAEIAVLQGQQIMARATAASQKPQGEKRERIFDTVQEALGFATLVNGVCYFWNESAGYKVVWYTYKEEVK